MVNAREEVLVRPPGMKTKEEEEFRIKKKEKEMTGGKHKVWKRQESRAYRMNEW